LLIFILIPGISNGVCGAQIFNAGEGISKGPVDFNSDKWLDMVI